MKVIDVYYSVECVYNRLVDEWRWGTTWEKVVEDDEGNYWMIWYRSAGGDSEIDLEDALYYKGDEEAFSVSLVDTIVKVGRIVE